MKLYSSLDSYGGYPFNILWPDVKHITDAVEFERGPGILVLWGGEDISPSIYGEKPGIFTGADDRPSPRDYDEIDMYVEAVNRGYPIIAICRGAQLVCALEGGKVIQHVENHAGISHYITTNDGRTFRSNSLHHQMMYPFNLSKDEFEMIAWTKDSMSSFYLNGEDKEIEPRPPVEPEVVYFPQSKTIAIQGHPEFIQKPSNPYVQYCLELARKYCAN